MTPTTRLLRAVAPAAAALVTAAALPSSAAAQEKVTFQDHVLPIFRNACNNCHNPDKKKAGLDLTTYAAALAGSDNGPVLNSGDPSGSMLFKTVTHAEEPTMPPKRDKLPAAELKVIEKWIAGGMLDTATGKAAAPSKPKVDLGAVVVTGKPTGPVAMPKELVTEPIVHTTRPGAVESLASSPWAPVIAVGGQKQIILYHSQTLEVLGVLPFDEGVPRVLKFSRNGNVLLAAGGQGAKVGKVVLFDVATGNRLTDVGDETDEVLAADISPDQKLVVLGGPGRVAKGYDVAEGKEQFVLKKHTDWVTAVAVSPDGNLIATGDRAGNLFVWEKDGGELYTLNGHKDAINSLQFRGDSKVLLSASKDASIKLWDMAEGKQVKTWDAHPKGVSSAAFTHDGRIVSAGRDKSAKQWTADGAAGKPLAPAFADIAMHATFDADGTRVFAGDWTGVVRVWNVADGTVVGELSPNPPRIADRLAAATKKLTDAEPAVAKAEADLKAATEAAAKADADHKTAVAKVESLKAELAAAEQKLATATADAAAKAGNGGNKGAAQIVEKRQQVEKLTAKLAEAESAAKAAAAAAAPAGAVDVKALEADLATKKQAVEEAKQALAAAERAAKEKPDDAAAKATLAEAKARVERRAGRVAEATKALDQAKAKPGAPAANKPDVAAAKAVADAKSALGKAQAELKSAEQSNADAGKAADAVLTDQKAAKAAVAKAKADLAAAEAQVKPLLIAATGAADKVAPAKKAADEAVASIAGAKFDVAKLKAQQAGTTLAYARKALAKSEQDKAAAADAAKAAGAAVEKAKADMAEFKKAREASPAKVRDLTAKLEPMKKKLADATAPADAAAAAVVERETLAEKVAEVARLSGELAAKSKDNKAAAEAALTAKRLLEQLSVDLAAAKESAAKLAEARKAAGAELAAAEQAIAKEKADTANAATILAGLTKAQADAEAEVPKRQAAATDAEKPIAEAKVKVDQAKAEYDRLAAEAAKLVPVAKG